MLSLALTFGLFFAACTQNPTIQEAKLNLNNKNYSQALAAANKAIEENSDAPEPYYYKGRIHYGMAEQEADPAQRTDNYGAMREALNTALQIYEKNDSQSAESKDIIPLLRSAWSEEHDRGTRIIDTDSSLTQSLMHNAIAHLKNATVIIPDSTVSYQALGNAYYRDGQISNAIGAFEQMVAQDSSKIQQVLEKLAFLYLEKGDANKATEYYQMADTTFQNDLNIMHGLANAYISRDNHFRAIPLLRDLNERAPQNVEYQLALGTELFYLARGKMDSVTTLYPRYKQEKDSSGIRDMQQKVGNIQELIQEAEAHMTEAVELDDGNVQILNSAATFHQNSANLFRKLADLDLPQQQTAELNSRIESHLKTAIPYLETLTETQQEPQKYWGQLFQIHSYLGNTEKADEAMKKSDL